MNSHIIESLITVISGERICSEYYITSETFWYLYALNHLLNEHHGIKKIIH